MLTAFKGQDLNANGEADEWPFSPWLDTRLRGGFDVTHAFKEGVDVWSEPSNEQLIPPVTPTQEESRRFAQIMTEVNTRYDEVFAQILTGAQPVELWDTFVGELEQLGIDEALEIQQAALDRYNKRA